MSDQLHLVMNWRTAMLAMLIVATAMTIGFALLRNIERRSVFWLALFVLAASLNTLPYIIGFAGAYDLWPGLTFLPLDFAPLFGPLFYFHARRLMTDQPVRRFWWLIGPGIVYWIYQVWAFTALGDYKAKWAYVRDVHDPYIMPLVVLVSLSLGVWSLISIWRIKRRYENWLEAERADGADFQAVWLKQCIVIAAPLLAIWTLEYALGVVFSLSFSERFWAYLIVQVLLLSLCLSALSSLHAPYPKMRLGSDTTEEDSVASERDWSEDGLRLLALVRAEAWYLEPGLSLNDLARRSGMNENYVSRAINRGLGVSFSHFINEMRTEHAKSLIKNGASNILDVALASGFGSKASFNRAFRLHTGKTPTEYRRETSQITL